MIGIDELRRALPTLDRDRFAIMVRTVLKVPPEEFKALRTATILRASLWEWLLHLRFIPDAGCRALLTEMTGAVEKFAKRLDEHPDLVPFAALEIASYRYATWPGRDQWFDTMFESALDADLPRRAVTHVVCDLGALHLEVRERLKHFRSKDAGHQHHAAVAPDGANGQS